MRFLQMSALALLSSGLMIAPVLTSSAVQDTRPTVVPLAAPVEAITGFGITNGFLADTGPAPTPFAAARTTFETVEDVNNDGLGPTYNDTSCVACHQNPVTGGISQVTEFRAGNTVNGVFTDHPGGSLIQDRATNPAIQEHLLPGNNTTTFRTSLNTLGDGFIESIDSNDINTVRLNQPAAMRGVLIQVPVVETGNPNLLRAGRFGWKNQHASLLSFSGDAYINEMGITNRLFPVENTSNGNSVAAFDPIPESPGVTEDSQDNDVDAFAAFMRSTAAPPRGPGSAAVTAGSAVFDNIGCNVCHVRQYTTAPAGTVINQGQFTVPAQLGNKIIHPFSDLLLHDVGTGDGIVQNGGAVSRLRMRTPPLWGVRTRTRLMHDGLSFTFTDAIQRHQNEAASVTSSFNGLSTTDKNNLLAFLASL